MTTERYLPPGTINTSETEPAKIAVTGNIKPEDVALQPGKEIPNLTEVPGTKGQPRIVYWRKLQEVKTLEELRSLQAEVAQDIGSNTVHIQLPLPPAEYLHLMELVWLAFRAGEITECNMLAYIDQALQRADFNIKQYSKLKWG